jgi:Rrf2 family protein
MKLSTRSRYGTRALLDLALHDNEAPILLRTVAQRQEVSPMYLEHLISPLITAGMIRSIRGAKGGIRLAKAPTDIRLDEVIGLLEGSIAPVECVNDLNYCHRSGFCVTRDLWGELKEAMEGILQATTLQDLVDRHMDKIESNEAMYHI